MDTIYTAVPGGPLATSLSAARGRRGPRRFVALSTVDELEKALGEGPPSVFILEPTVDGVWDLVRRLRVEGKNGESRIPLLLLEPPGPVPFLILPDERVAAPFDATKVSTAIDEVIDRRATALRIFLHDVAIEIASTPDAIDQAADFFVGLLSSTGFTDHDQVALENTFREAVGNAAEHGNKKDPAKKIRILYLRDADRIAFVVSDEGPGFDHRKFLARADEVSALEHTRSRRSNEARPGGLGVFIMKKTCDAICFNDSGNSIYLMKRLPGRGGKAG